MLVKSVEELIGSTPLIEIGYLSVNRCRILAKAEYLNPSSSIKDRIAQKMIDEAINRGKISSDTVVIEPTSGNTGIGLAMICAIRGIKLILTMPESMSMERQKLLTHLGAKIELTPAEDGMNGAIVRAIELKEEYPDSYIPDQFTNPNNPMAHEENTAIEILNDASLRIDIFVAAIGTGGTLTGVARVLKKHIDNIRIVGVEPEKSPIISKGVSGIHKIEGIGAGFIPDTLDVELLDEVRTISEETAIAYAKDASLKAGILCGMSSGANLAMAHALAKENVAKTIVTILPDTAHRYLSTKLFE